MDETRAVFAERWGVEATFESYVGELGALTPKYVELRGGRPRPGFCGNYSRRVVFVRIGCISERTYPHEYFHVLQDALRGDRDIHVPTWLVEGTAGYGEVTQQGVVSDPTAVADHVDRDLRSRIATLIRHDLPSLASIEDPAEFHEHGIVGYDLGFLAVDWLVDHSAEESIVDFFKELAPPAVAWQEAFEAVFGITADEFYEAFEPYLAEVAPPLPHLTDDSDEPVLVFLGDVPSAAQAAVRTEFGKVRAFFTDRFGAETPDFTAYVGADADSVAATHLQVFGQQPEEMFCYRSIRGRVVIVILSCGEPSLHYLDRRYFDAVRAKIAPWESLPAVPDGHNRLGPDWLLLATESYTASAYRAATGIETFSRIRDREIARARGTAQPLRSMETRAGVDAAGFWEARALAFLAAGRLVARAGEPALFAYYRALPSSANWGEAFETVFGITADEFYEAFEPYLAEVAPPLPHLTDDSDEPVLVFLGDVPSAAQAAVRTEFGKVRAFFTDRFGAETPDFTAYVGADADSVTATHLQVFGRQPEEMFCDRSIRGRVVIVILSCGEPPLHYLDRHYFNAVRAKIAPWESLPAVPDGHNRLGPDWLLLATESYTASAYRAATGIETFSRIRDREIARARGTAQPLRSMETRAGVDAAGFWEARALAFLAAGRLVARAGEPALFAYYRALPSSANWGEAFETVFGITADEFYEAFEPYLAEVAPPR